MELKPGMTFTIEPMINAGKFAKNAQDGWTTYIKMTILSNFLSKNQIVYKYLQNFF